MATSLVTVGYTGTAEAARAFGAPRFSTNATGDISFTANTVLTCPSSAANCTNAQAKTYNGANNQFSMINVDVDSDASTFNSSSATMAPPAGSTVLWAGLYWSGVSTNGNRNTMSLDTPAAGGYQNITASVLDTDGSYYQAFADVTSLVTADGFGVYTGANVYANTGGGRYGGWSLVLAYSNSGEPFRNLSVFDGFERVNQNSPVDITVSGFLTPPIGPVSANIGVIAYEGDNRYSGDYAEFEGVRLSDGLNPATNFFNSTISTGGAYNTGMNPQYRDQLGFDAKVVSTSGVVPTSATSADIALRSTGDWYWPGVVTTAIDIFVPNLVLDLEKRVTDLNGGDVNPGDVLEYTISFTNQGNDPALDVAITDAIPTGSTYVPGSLVIVDGDNPGSKTDAGGDDQGLFSGGTATFNLGTGATSTGGGRIDPFAMTGTSYEMTFQVEVDAGTEGTTIDNQARIGYTAFTTGDVFDEPTNTVSVPVEALADLRFVSKTDDVDPVTAGEAFTYTLTIANHGPSPAVNTVVIDTLPAGLTFAPGTSDPSCGAAGQVVTCNRGNLAAGTALAPVTDSFVIGVTADGAAATGFVTNSARVDSDTPDAEAGDNTSSEKTEVERLVDLTVTKSGSPDPVLAGEAVTYTIVVSNNGPSDAANATMVDTIPAGTLVQSTSATSGGTCASGASSVTCTWPVLEAGTSETVTVVVDVASSAADGSTLVNKAGVSADDPEDPAGAPDATEESVAVDREIDLVVTKEALGSAVPGTTLQYGVTVVNNGPSDATAVDVVDTLPAGVSFNAGLSTSSCVEAAGVVTCPVGDLVAGAPAVDITIAVDLPSSMADGVVLYNEVEASADEGDSNVAVDDTATSREVDLGVVKSHNIDPVVAGDPLTYTLTVNNAGPSDSTNASVTDTLPDLAATAGADVVFVSANPGDPTCTHAGGVVTCAGIDLDAGDSTTITIVTTVAAGIPDGAVLTNAASVAAGTGETETNPADNTTELDTQVQRSTLLDVVKSEKAPASDPVVAGTAFTYEIVVINAGSSQDDNVQLVDDLNGLPVTFQSVSPAGLVCGEAAGVVTCDWASLAPGASETVEITVLVDPGAADGVQFGNTATADGDFSVPASGVEETTVNRVAVLDLTKTGPASINAGEVATYQLTLVNDGPSNASNVVINDLLPLGTVHVATRVIAEPSAGSVSCGPVGGIEVCSLAGELVPTGAITVEIDVLTSTSLNPGDTITNVVTAEADEDPDGADDRVDTSVERSTDLAINKANPNGDTPAGGSITYDITVTNNGPSDGTDVTVTDSIPAGLSFNPAGSDASCTQVGSNVVCNLGDMDPDDPAVSLSLSFDVSDSYGDGTVTNVASVVADEDDPVPGNDDSTDVTTIYTEADLVVLKTSPAGPAVPGTNYAYTVEVTNDGPSLADAVVLEDTLPPGTTFVAGSSSPTCSPAVADVVCTQPALAPGATVVFTITVAVPSSHVGPLVNSAEASSDTTDPTPANNTDTDTSPTVPSADLSLTKTATPDPVLAGGQVSYTLTVANAGPSDAVDVEVSDVLPSTMSFVSAASDPRCSAAGQAVTCSAAALAPTDTPLEFTVVVNVASSVPAGLALVNSASTASATDDPNPANDTDTAAVQVEREADLTLTKTATPDPVVAGEDVTYTLTVTNNGPSDASGVAVTDTLPIGMTVQSAVASAGSCSTTASTASCGASTLASGASLVVTVVAETSPSLADGATVVNSASVDANEEDPDVGNNTATAPVEIQRVVGLAIQKTSAAKPLAVPGEDHPFEIRVTNTGSSDATGVVVTDNLPAGATFVADDLGVCSAAGQTVTCALGSIAAGTSTTVVLTVQLDASLVETGSVDNDAGVTSNEPDDDLSDNTDDVSVPIERVADLSVLKSGPTEPVVAGTPFTYQLSVDNLGPSNATNVEVTDTLPTGVTYVPSGSDPACSAVGQVVTCVIPTMAAAAGPLTLDLVVLTDADLVDGSSLSNTAVVVADENDPDPDNNSSIVATEIKRDSGLEIVKTDSADPAIAGTQLTYTLTGTNLGPSVIDNVVISDTLPSGATFVSALSSSECDETLPGVVACSLGTVLVADPQVVTVVVDLGPDLAHASQVENAAAITGDDAVGDATTEETTIERSSDLSLVKSGPAGPVLAGESATWTLSIDNLGSSDASDVVVTDPVPAGLTFVSAGSDSRCALVGSDVVCTIGTVPVADAPDTIDLVFLVSSDFANNGADSVTNEATVAGNEADPDPDNNADAVSTAVVTAADLSLTKASPTADAVPGTTYTYTLTVTNNGPSDALNVNVADTLPSGTSFVGAGSSAACGPAGGQVSCVFGTLAAGDTEVLTVVVDVPADFVGNLVNSAEVSSDTPDLDPDNNTDQDTSAATPSADLSLTKTVSPDPVLAGTQATYVLTVDNLGPSDAVAVEAVDTLPAGMSFVALDSDNRCAASGQTVTCAAATSLGPDDAPLVFTVVVDVASSVADASELVNSAIVGSDTDDPDPENNAGTAPVEVLRSADLSLTKTVTPDPVSAGTAVTYTIVVTNNGPSDATNVVTADALPVGIVPTAAATDVGTCAVTTTAVDCDAPVLVDGEVMTITVDANVRSDAADGATLVNSAAVAGDETDPDPDNNGDTAPVDVERSIDLSVTKTALTKPTAVPGENQPFEISVTNDGPSDASSVVVTDTLPAGWNFVAGSSSAICGAAGQLVTCAVGTLPAGVTVNMVITALLPSDLADGSTITNTVEVAGTEPDSDPDNDTDDVVVPVVRLADMSIVKAGPLGPVDAGTTYDYTLTVNNLGPSNATGVTVTDTLPPGATFVVAGSSPECSAVGQNLTCVLGDVADASFPTVLTVTVLSAAGLPDGAVLSNTAGIAANEADPNANNNTSSVLTDIERSSGLEIVKTDSADPAVAGTQLSYTITVTNMGPSVTDNVVVTDQLPPGATLDEGLSSPLCEEPAAGVLECALGTVAVNDPQVITVVVDLDEAIASGDQIVNRVEATADSAELVVTEEETTVVRSVDLWVTKVADRPDRVAGEPVTYTITIGNDGPSTATGVTVTDVLPPGAIFQSSVPAAPDCGDVGALVTCVIDSLGSGTTADITITVLIDPAMSTGADFTNNVSVEGNEADANPLNDLDDDRGVVSRVVDLTVQKQASEAVAVAGENFAWTILVTNNGPSDASNVTVTDVLPPGVTFAAAASSPACVETTAGEVSCDLDIVANGAVEELTIVGLVAADLPASTVLTNTATVDSDESAPDTASADTPVTGEADLSLVKTSLTNPLTAGAAASYELVVSNAGPSAATNVVISDILPEGLTFDEATSDSACVLGVTCSIGSLGAGETVTVILGVELAADLLEPVQNTAGVSTDTFDPETENNTDDDETEVVQLVNLSVEKVADATVAVAGLPLNYVLTATNSGPSDATGVTIVDMLPSSLTFVAADSSSVCVEQPTGTITCDAGDLADGESAAVSISVLVDPALESGSDITNSATVGGNEPNANPDPTATTVTPSGAAAGLSLAKASDAFFVPGTDASYVLDIANAGPSLATDVVISDELPSGVQFVPEASDTRCRAAAGVVICTIGDMAVDASDSVTLGVLVSVDLDGSVLNTATATSTAGDDPVVVQAAVETPVVPESALSIAKTVDTDRVEPGAVVLWNVRVSNAGPSPAREVSVVDDLPAGLGFVAAQSSAGCSASGTTVTCVAPSLAVGDDAVFVVATTVSADLGDTSITNIATVAAVGATSEPSSVASLVVDRPAAPSGPLAFTGGSALRLAGFGLMLGALGLLLVTGTRRSRQ